MFDQVITVESKYEKIARVIREMIASGELTSGSKIPNENELSDRFQVSRNTVRDALGLLLNENLLVREKGRGTFVSQGYASRQETTLGLLMYGLGSPVIGAFTDMVFEGARSETGHQSGCRLELLYTDGQTSARDFMTMARERNMAGIMVMGAKFADEAFFLEVAKRLPLVLLGKIIPGSAIPAVTPDATLAMRLALEHLFCLGHRRIAYLPSFLHHVGYREKLDSFLEIYEAMCHQHGVPFQPCYELGDYEKVILPVMEKFTPTAVISSSDTGILAMNTLLNHGYRVPEDVSFMALDDLGKAPLANPPMTVVKSDNVDIGRQGINLLLRLARREKVPLRVKVGCNLMVRKSTRPIA